MIAGVLIMLMSGFVYAWSVIAKPIAASRTEWTAASLSFTFTLVMICFCAGGMIAGFLGNRILAKVYVLIGSIFFLGGFFLASLTGGTVILLYIGIGILCGFGAGVVYNVVMSTMSAWYPHKQGMISGIMMMGFGFSSFFFGKIYSAITPADGLDGWKVTFRIMGAVISAAVFVCSFLIKRPDASYRTPQTKKKKRESALEASPGIMVKTPVFWLYYIWACLIGAGCLAVVSQAAGIATEAVPTLSAGTIATAVGLISLFNGIGRVIFGVLFDRAGYRVTMILVMAVFLCSLLLLVMAMTTGSFEILLGGFIGCGLSYGGITPLASAVISDFFGGENYSKNFSIITTTLMVSSVSSTIAGRLYDGSGSYRSTIYTTIGMLLVSVVLFFFIHRPDKQSINKKYIERE